MTKDTLATIIASVQENRNLLHDLLIPLVTVRTRIKCGKLFAFHYGHTTMLLNMEPICVSTIKQMCQISSWLTPHIGIALVNSMIHGTEAQK